MARLHEQDLAAVHVGERPDQLVAPRLLDLADREGPPVERVDVRRVDAHRRLRSTRPRREPLRMRLDVLGRRSQLLRRVDREPEARVAEGAQAALGRELGEGRRLVVAPLGEPLDRFFGEDVVAAVDPVRHAAAFAEPAHEVVVVDVDEAELRLGLGDGDRRERASRPVSGEQAGEVDVDELVAVQGIDVALLVPERGSELDPAAAAEPLGLLGGDDLRAEARQLRDEQLALARGAREDHAGDTGRWRAGRPDRRRAACHRPRRGPSAVRRQRHRAARPCRRRG